MLLNVSRQSLAAKLIVVEEFAMSIKLVRECRSFKKRDRQQVKIGR